MTMHLLPDAASDAITPPAEQASDANAIVTGPRRPRQKAQRKHRPQAVLPAPMPTDADLQLLHLYKRNPRDRGLSPDTLNGYRSVFDAFVRHLHERELTLLTARRVDVTEWISSRGNTNRTRSIYLSRLALLFQWLQDEGHRDDLPTKGLIKPKVPRSVPRPIPTADLQRALALADPRVRLMLTLAAYAGLRRSEIAKVERADLIYDGDKRLLLVHGKGGKERLVPIGPVVAQAMANYGLPAHGPLFLGQYGKAITRGYVGSLISEHLRSCGIDCTAHQGRHWFATTLYQRSGDLRITQEMMGHASPTTTAVYAAYSPEKAAIAIAAL